MSCFGEDIFDFIDEDNRKSEAIPDIEGGNEHENER